MSAPQTRTRHDRGETERIVDMMRGRIRELVRVWRLGDGYCDGHDWVCLNPLRGDRHPGSFRVALSGPFQGMVTDFCGEAYPGAGRQSVSPLNWHIQLMHQGNARDGIQWVKDWLGLTGRDPAALKVSHRALQDFDGRPVQDNEQLKNRRKLAQSVYLKGVPILGTPGWEYFKGRGLDLELLPGPIGALRFNPACFCGELRRELPAIVMPIVAQDGAFLGVHRIWIDRRPDGRWVKHPGLKKAKKAFGAYAGGVIRLWNGQRVLERTGEIVYGRDFASEKGPMRVHMCEGPEDGVGIALACPDERVHVAVSVSNWSGIAYPDKVETVVLWRDGDAAGSGGDKGFQRVLANQHAQGKTVLVADIASVMPGVKDPTEVFEKMDSRA